MHDEYNMELSFEEMVSMGGAAVRALAAHIRDLPDAPRSDLDHAVEASRALRESAPEEGMAFEPLLDFFMKRVIPVSINTAHPQYIGYIPGGGLYPSAVADFLAAATNRYSGAWFAAPAAVRLEANVLEWFAQWMGYPETARGILTSGGSLANLSAVVTARHHLLGDDISRGVMYASDQTHHCVMKAARLAGIAERCIRLLPVDERFRAVPRLFDHTIRQDMSRGLKPFLIVANAGTTNTGAVDPLTELCEVAHRHGIWCHADAAYGGFFNLCPEGKKRLSGLSLCDSIVLDPHKGLFLPYGSGSLLVKNGECLRLAHQMSAAYLQDHDTPDGEYNPTEYSPELSRGYHGLRVWLPLKYYGVRTFRKNLAEKLQLSEWLYQRLKQEPHCEVLCPPDLSVVPFRFVPSCGDAEAFNRLLLKSILESKRLFISSTLLNNRFVLRACILSFRTHQAEVEAAAETICSTARRLLQN